MMLLIFVIALIVLFQESFLLIFKS